MALEMNSSKEFQMILQLDHFEVAFVEGLMKVIDMLQELEDRPELKFNYITGTGGQWSRTSDRYDTSDTWLAAHNLSCAVEFSILDGKRRSKLKLKHNVWDPEAAYDKNEINKCIVCPDQDYEKFSKLKLEQDFNAKGTKFGLSGSIKIDETDKVTFRSLSDLVAYFRRIHHLDGYRSTTPLTVTSSYSETVFDDIELKVGPHNLLLEGSLGCRYNSEGHPFKVEFSIKAKEPDEGWRYADQVYLSQLFYAMIHHDLHGDHEKIINRSFPPVAIQS